MENLLQKIDFQDNISLIFTAVLFFAFAIQAFYYLYFYTGTLRRKRKIKKNKVEFNHSQPPVSVIICAKNEEKNLAKFLPLILEQDYFDYEVIVVNDGSWDNTKEVVQNFAKKYQRLYLTSLPNDVKVVSSKKLALTVGIKAAKNEILLFADADCRPASKNWISMMVRNMGVNTEFVLGFGDYFRKKSLLNRLISFDTLFIAMQYLGFAFRGQPYMGVGRNLMYRKSTFFRLKGFAGHLHISAGDDDLMVNLAAKKRNTAIECSAESKTISVPKTSFLDWIIQKRRHLDVSACYKAKSKQLIGFEVFTRGLFYIFLILTILRMNLFYTVVAALLFLIRYIIQLVVINRVSAYLGVRKFFISLLFWDILLPLISLYLTTIDKIFYRKKRCRY
ncbi:MAG: glycosyltransferase [Prevotellaceae bacterium]|jgi:glycosyltransferase involved in cell wall biosynthesis|nr:glycosyltransferase [Prevotellaceae bacterium]